MELIAHARIDASGLSLDQSLLFAARNGSDMLRGLYDDMGMDHPKFHKMDRYARAQLLCTEPLLRRSGETMRDPTHAIGSITVNRTACMRTDVDHWQDMRANDTASPALFVYTLPNIGAAEISIRHRMHGPSICLVADPPDGALLLAIARGMMERDGVQQVLLGGADIFASAPFAAFVLLGGSAHDTITAERINQLLSP